MPGGRSAGSAEAGSLTVLCVYRRLIGRPSIKHWMHYASTGIKAQDEAAVWTVASLVESLGRSKYDQMTDNIMHLERMAKRLAQPLALHKGDPIPGSFNRIFWDAVKIDQRLVVADEHEQADLVALVALLEDGHLRAGYELGVEDVGQSLQDAMRFIKPATTYD
jgi:hypothetical protein